MTLWELIKTNKKKWDHIHSLFSQQQATHNTIQKNREIHVKDREIHVKDRYCGITILILKIER